jgi:hypothetical protein
MLVNLVTGLQLREVSDMAHNKSSPELVTEPLPDLMQMAERNFERHRLAATILGSLVGVIAGLVWSVPDWHP